MAIHKTLLPLCAGLVFGATLASEAKAQSDAVLEYAAKFGPNQAEFVDCPLIYSLLSIEPPAHIEGFVVIEVVPEVRLGIAALPLDVVGKYSARPSTGEVSSLDVVVYSPMQISN
jgi:hypothetical protein